MYYTLVFSTRNSMMMHCDSMQIYQSYRTNTLISRPSSELPLFCRIFCLGHFGFNLHFLNRFWPTYPKPISKRSVCIRLVMGQEKFTNSCQHPAEPLTRFFIFGFLFFGCWSHFTYIALRQLKLWPKVFYMAHDFSFFQDVPLRLLKKSEFFLN